MQLLTVAGLFIYPIKSLGGVEVNSVKVLPKGFEFDRRWMLIDADNMFMTQRTSSKLALFSLEKFDGSKEFTVHYKGERIVVRIVPQGESFTATVWDDSVEVHEVSKEVSNWFSRQLGIACKLVFFPEDNNRPVDPDFALSPNNQTSLSDGYPILIIGQSSLDDLNSRFNEPIEMDRFRPNIVMKGSTPYAEDSFIRFSIGGIPLAGVKPCGRCTVTTVNQQTGETGKEPLATLSAYRKKGNKVLFGQNVIPLGIGEIGVGDEIFLESVVGSL